MIKTITNLMPSTLDISAVKDVNGNPVTLRPAGSPGSSRDLPIEAWRHDAVERVIEMKWAKLASPNAAEPVPAKVEAPPPAPVVVEVPPPAPEPIKDETPPPVAPSVEGSSESIATDVANEPAPVEPVNETAEPAPDERPRGRNRR